MRVATNYLDMKQDYFQSGGVIDSDDVLTALNDDQSRKIIRALRTGSKTASELSQELEIPLSSLYRKLNSLADASLLGTAIEIRTNGKHATRYSVAFNSITVDINNEGLEIDVSRPSPITS